MNLGRRSRQGADVKLFKFANGDTVMLTEDSLGSKLPGNITDWIYIQAVDETSADIIEVIKVNGYCRWPFDPGEPKDVADEQSPSAAP
jgi:hypothetical protein